MSLITPHGAASLTPLIATGERLAALETESASLPSITVSSAAAANAAAVKELSEAQGKVDACELALAAARETGDVDAIRAAEEALSMATAERDA